ncbi:Threonine efflux protein [Photorhabdus australis subsp. thailandensis]|uniref:Threonine efflux protein n=1 Tax=Photorhabdus australis subsp. thailandensis TaxID=2805096 RepID=A0A1C0U5P8_9GAMM|nr:LysE family transporter [Photorhabdus australis]OCQ53257.1 Threonine efflux protein [Photorhabdus australis subsp. thailandensis]
MSIFLHEFLELALIHFLAVVVPGPDFAVTVRQSTSFGRKAGIYTAIGIGAGISVHVIYTLIGIGTIMHALPWLLNTVRLIGGVYLFYLGVCFIRKKADTSVIAENQGDNSGVLINKSLSRSLITGFVTNATNPKATLFFLAIFTTVVSAKTPMSIQIFYGFWMCAVNALWFVFVSLIFSSMAVRNRFVSYGHWIERIMGLLLIFFSVRLLFWWDN